MCRLPPSSTRTDPLFPYTTLFRAPYRRVRAEVEGVAGAVEHLRHQAGVGQAGRIDVTEPPGAPVAGQHALERCEALGDAVVEPIGHLLLRAAERVAQVLQGPEGVDRMAVEGDHRSQGPHAGAAARCGTSGKRCW